jgi:hypothetical protein
MVAAFAVCAHCCLWGIGVSSTFIINLYNTLVTIFAAVCKLLAGNIGRHNGLNCKGCTESGEVSRGAAAVASPQTIHNTYPQPVEKPVDGGSLRWACRPQPSLPCG